MVAKQERQQEWQERVAQQRASALPSALSRLSMDFPRNRSATGRGVWHRCRRRRGSFQCTSLRLAVWRDQLAQRARLDEMMRAL